MSLRKFALLPLMALSLGASAALADNDRPVGYDRLEVEAAHRARPLAASLWYPAGEGGYRREIGDNPVFKGGPVQFGAAVREGRYPLVLLSHGSGGSAENMNWLASALARGGRIVLAVNHAGSTTGDASSRRAIRHWNRPQDLSAALDRLAADKALAPAVDFKDVTALGFSLGGMTVLSLGGALMDLDQYRDYCRTYRDRAADCTYFQKGGFDLGSLPKVDFEQDLRDPRIGRLIAIDPGLAYGMTEKSLKAMKPDLQVINLGTGADRLFAADSGANGNRLTEIVPGLRYDVVPLANHFSFLGLCKPDADIRLEEEGEDPICNEPVGGSRVKAHARILELVRDFLTGGQAS